MNAILGSGGHHGLDAEGATIDSRCTRFLMWKWLLPDNAFLRSFIFAPPNPRLWSSSTLIILCLPSILYLDRTHSLQLAQSLLGLQTPDGL